MKPVKAFESFISSGTVKKVSHDLNRASFLREEAGKRILFLKELQEKIGIKDNNANYIIENSYNILSEMLRAKMLESGYSASGLGAHEAEVAFMKELSFPDADVMHKNVVKHFCAGFKTPPFYGDIFGVLKIRLLKRAADQTLPFRAGLAALGGFL